VLIYLEPVLQKRALTTFHYALNELGFLMLGKSESVGNNSDMFTTYNSREKIFRRSGARGRFMQVTTQGSEQNFKDIDTDIRLENGQQDVFKVGDNLLLSKYVPASVLVNERFDIIQFRGKTNIWLDLPSGKASFNLLKMAREGLAFEIRNLFHLAKRTNAAARKENILFNLDNQQQYVHIEAAPLSGAADTHYLVLFEKGSLPGAESTVDGSGKNKKRQIDLRDTRIAQQDRELLQVRADMRTVTEEQEAANEELQSANQELLSGSENCKA